MSLADKHEQSVDENEVVFISGFVVSASEAQGAFHCSGRVVAPGKNQAGRTWISRTHSLLDDGACEMMPTDGIMQVMSCADL